MCTWVWRVYGALSGGGSSGAGMLGAAEEAQSGAASR